MEIPFGNIFEITINSNKLYNYIDDILAQLRDHNHKIQHLNQRIGGITTTFNEKIKMNDYNIDIQLQKIRKASQEQMNYVRLFMRDVDKKANDKINEIESTLTFLNSKMIKVKETIEDDIAYKLSYMDKRLASITTLQEDQKIIKEQIIKLREQIVQVNYKIEKISVNIQDGVKRNFQTNDFLMQRISQLEKNSKFQNQNIQPLKCQIFEDKAQSKSKKRKEKQEQRQSQIFSNIINKIEQVEQNLSKDIENKSNLHQPRRSMVSNSKVVKSNTDIINQLPKSGFAIKNGGKFKEFQNLVMQKLQKLQSLSVQKFEFFEKQINKVTNKNEIIDEHIGILSRKIDKEKFKITQVTENMKRFDDKRIDQRTIQNLKNMIKKLSKDTEEMLQTKLTKEVYQKQKQKNIEKMQFLNQFIIEKAEKSQVKKGLAFLEQKIKEIIIVLAEQRGSGQDGAMKKTPYKCLSCDKGLQVDRQDLQGRITPKQNLANITRCNTNQLRKRIRMINNTTTTNQNDD